MFANPSILAPIGFILAILMALALLRWRRPTLPLATPAGEIAPDEWYRVRRTREHTTRAARALGAVEIFSGVVIGAVGFYEASFRGDLAWMVLFGPLMIGFGMEIGGLMPSWITDCLATTAEIRFFDPRGEIIFERPTTTARIRTLRNRIRPYRLELTATDGTTRRLALDDHGVSTLRALGWIDENESRA
ncbi:MAG: hypothetical protein CMJ31_14465 [Phycisphaerae bacterium]|nr:hypothetical protein [Phycisphaerae bacterium]